MTAYPRTIKAAAKFLDKHEPGWADRVNLDRLDMNEGHTCILGQVFMSQAEPALDGDGFGFAVTKFGWEKVDVSDKIFGWHAPVDVWTKEILSRQIAMVKVPKAFLVELCDIAARSYYEPSNDMDSVAELLVEYGFLKELKGYQVTL